MFQFLPALIGNIGPAAAGAGAGAAGSAAGAGMAGMGSASGGLAGLLGGGGMGGGFGGGGLLGSLLDKSPSPLGTGPTVREFASAVATGGGRSPGLDAAGGGGMADAMQGLFGGFGGQGAPAGGQPGGGLLGGKFERFGRAMHNVGSAVAGEPTQQDQMQAAGGMPGLRVPRPMGGGAHGVPAPAGTFRRPTVSSSIPYADVSHLMRRF